MNWLRFQEPWWLALLVPVALGLWWSAPRIRGMAKARRRVALTVRSALAVLACLALAAPQVRWRNEGVATVFVLDVSDSMPAGLRDTAAKFIDSAFRKAGPKDKVGLVVFGRQPAVELLPRSTATLGAVRSVVDGSGSDLAAGIRLASAILQAGSDRRIVVLSDGNETQGDAVEAVRALSTDGVVVDTVDLKNLAKRDEVAVISVEGPDQTRPDQPFDLRVVVDATTETTGTLTLDRDGVVISTTKVKLQAGHNALLVQDQVKEPGFYRYRASLTAAKDTDPRNNVGMAFVSSKDRMRVLVIRGKTADESFSSALEKGGISVDRRTPATMPNRPDQLQPYDVVFLNNVPAQDFAEAQIESLRAACRDTGVGLAMIGGEDSYLSGGWYGTPVAEALPVDLDVRNRKTFPTTSMVIIADASGSMQMQEDGVEKIKLAARAAAQTVRMLGANDRLAVGGSSDGIEWVFPMGPVGDRQGAIDQVMRLKVNGGGIYIRPSINKAREVMEKEQSKVRHIIMICDGDDSTDWETALDTARILFQEKITTSVIAVGDGKDVAMLRALAASGGGQFFLATSASQLPAIVTQDTAVMARSAIVEEPFYPKVVGIDDAIRGLDRTPSLQAYNLVDSRPTARTSLVSHKDDPLLATWQYGLGSSLAFMSDAQPKWAAQWVGWDGFSTFWSQAARSIARRGLTGKYSVQVTPGEGRAMVTVKSLSPGTDSRPPEGVTVSGPDGKAMPVVLKATGPGEFTGSFDAAGMGSYIVAVSDKADGVTKVSTSGFSVAYPPEYRSTMVNTPLLSQIAESGHGELIPLDKPERAVRASQNPGSTLVEAWPWLVGLCLLLLPIDVAVRRLTVSVFSLIRLPRSVPAQPQATERTSRLKAAKRRAVEPIEPAAGVKPQIEEKREPVSPPTPRKEAPPVRNGGSTANRLLDAKKKRRDEP